MALLRAIKWQIRRRYPVLWRRARLARKALRLARRLYGFAPRECTTCGYQGKFLAEIHFPDIFTYDAQCPHCGSLPRNRLLMLAITEHGLITAQDRIVHFAPEACVYAALRALVRDYVTADLNPVGVDMAQDIEALTLPAGATDVIICSHVLEHVDHRKALASMFAAMAPGGRLLAMFPIIEGWAKTYENPGVISRHDRGLHFGRGNHLRRFGRDVRQAFAAAGFVLTDITADGAQCVRYGLTPGETVFVATKPG